MLFIHWQVGAEQDRISIGTQRLSINLSSKAPKSALAMQMLSVPPSLSSRSKPLLTLTPYFLCLSANSFKCFATNSFCTCPGAFS